MHQKGAKVEINVKGYPRPVLPLDGKNTPLPWIGADGPETGEWAKMETIRTFEAEDDKLCIICGLELPADFIFLLVGSVQWSTFAGNVLQQMVGALPSPTWVHPKCGQIAALYCPHLKAQEYPAITQDEQRLTHEQLRELARTAPKPE